MVLPTFVVCGPGAPPAILMAKEEVAQRLGIRMAFPCAPSTLADIGVRDFSTSLPSPRRLPPITRAERSAARTARLPSRPQEWLALDLTPKPSTGARWYGPRWMLWRRPELGSKRQSWFVAMANQHPAAVASALAEDARRLQLSAPRAGFRTYALTGFVRACV